MLWYVVISIILIIYILICKYFVSNKKDIMNEAKNEIKLAEINDENDNSFPLIQIVENNNIVPSEANKVIETKIKNEIAKIDNILTKSIMSEKNIKAGTELISKNKTMFSAIVDKSNHMMSAGNGQNYGAVVSNKTGKIVGQTKFTNEGALVKNAGTNALVNAGFNTVSMVVGQYYMAEINNKLEDIQNNISEISEYLDSEYQGKLMFIISKLKEIIDNKAEILSNKFSIKKRYDEVIDLEKESTVLLGQANEELKKNIKNENIEYKDYEKKIDIISKWFTRQQILQKILLEIANLRYALSEGNETSKLSHTQYNRYLQLTNAINEQLENYHKNLIGKFGIDIENIRRKGNWLQKNVAGKLKEEWGYNKIHDNTIKKIYEQSKIEKPEPYIRKKQDEVIKIQKCNGEYYNLINNK